MVMAGLAASLYALGIAFELVSWATVQAPSSIGFGDAGSWVQFAAAVAALGAVGTACWQLADRRWWPGGAELAAGAAGTVLYVGPMLRVAVLAPAAKSLQAAGIGVWAILALGMAALQVPAARDTTTIPGQRREAMLWLAAAASLALIAVGIGLSPAGDRGVMIAAGALQATGAAGLCAVMAAARNQRSLTSRSADYVRAAFAVLAGADIANVLIFDVVLRPGPGSIIVSRLAGAAVFAFLLVYAVALAGAAWAKASELVTAPRRTRLRG
jgi:hypothetical protein